MHMTIDLMEAIMEGWLREKGTDKVLLELETLIEYAKGRGSVTMEEIVGISRRYTNCWPHLKTRSGGDIS